MQRIYGARDSIEAEFVKSLLEAEEIKAVVQGSALEGAGGHSIYSGFASFGLGKRGRSGSSDADRGGVSPRWTGGN